MHGQKSFPRRLQGSQQRLPLSKQLPLPRGGRPPRATRGSQGPVSREGCSELVCFRELEEQQRVVGQRGRGWDRHVNRGNGQQGAVVQPPPVQGASPLCLRLLRAARRGFGRTETWQRAQQI